MDNTSSELHKPKFRSSVSTEMRPKEVEISFGARRCAFNFDIEEGPAVARLIAQLTAGGLTLRDLASQSPEIAEQIPALVKDLDRLHLLVESEPTPAEGQTSGVQLYREVRRLTDRVTQRVAQSSFQQALVEARATRAQLIGYALEYFWIVKMAPGLIGPALATARSPAERALIQDFLRSELGHDTFLGGALEAVGISAAEREAHQPLPATFVLGASLGVYARQHPLSFKAALFLFERAQPDFIDAFDERCRDLGLPEAFYAPLRAHAELNSEYAHEDISRLLMAFEPLADLETTVVVKRHIALLIETLIQQEEQILGFYGIQRDRIPRIWEGG